MTEKTHFQIKSNSDDILFEGEFESLKDCLEEAVRMDVNLEAANLSWSDFKGANLTNAKLRYACCEGSDFNGANLSHSDLSHANLKWADCEGANLSYANVKHISWEGANMTGSNMIGTNLHEGVPVIKNIHKAVYEAASKEDALNQSDWHIGETTHNWAGWAVHLAGEAGYEREADIGTHDAAAAIYFASDPSLECLPDFHTPNDISLAEMKRLAEQEEAHPVE